MSRATELKEDLIEQLQLADNSKMTAEEKSDQLEKTLKREEIRIAEVEKELSKLREIQVIIKIYTGLEIDMLACDVVV